jgi:glyoxylase-like metal-dependent hydrolase (beta-lactamase superfamily II)
MEPREVAAGVYSLKVRGANIYLVKSASSWVLIDAGWGGCAGAVRAAAGSLFGPAAPAAILLTHAHPDHFGAAAELARSWDRPVYVHADDMRMLLGQGLAEEDIDPIGKVFNAALRLLPQRLQPRPSTSEFEDIARELPESGDEVPGLPDWQWVPTPGHSPGHVVFFRPSDRVAIAGDAVLTTPFFGVVPGWQKLARPPRMSSSSWRRTMESIAALAGLEPRVLATGHGVPMTGPELARQLHAFSDRCSMPAVRRRA